MRSSSLVLLLALAAGCVPTDTEGVVVTADVSAAEGAVLVHPAGARLQIPPGALSADATVRLRDDGTHEPEPEDQAAPLLPWSTRFGIDWGGASLDGPVGLAILPPEVVGGDVEAGPPGPDRLVLVAVGADGYRRVTGVGPVDDVDVDEGFLVGEVGSHMMPELAVDPDGFYDFELQWVPPARFVLDDGVLDAPFYTQDGLQWCELTSMAMLYNFHASTPTGLTSPWHLASLYDTPADVPGVPPDGVLAASGGLAYAEGIYWNAELVPSAPFNDYLRAVIGGRHATTLTSNLDDGVLGWMVYETGIEIAPRPVQTTSETGGGLHGYLVTGVTDEGVRVHDSSGALTGLHGLAGELTWDAFRDTVAKEGDKDLWTAVLDLPVRPPEERRGSLVLRGGFDPSSSFTFRDDLGTRIKWLWDGEEPHTFGYYWGFDVGACEAPTPELGCNFRLRDGVVQGALDYDFHVANLTAAVHDFRVDMTLWRLGGGGRVGEATELVDDAKPLVWDEHPVSGTLSLAGISEEGRYELQIVLRQDDVVQDVKTVKFEVKE